MSKLKITIEIDSEDMDMIQETIKEDYNSTAPAAGTIYFILADWLCEKTGMLEFDDLDKMVNITSDDKDYAWEEINQALMERGYSPKQILRLLRTLNEIKKA